MFSLLKKKKATDVAVIEEDNHKITIAEDQEDFDDESASPIRDVSVNAVRTGFGFAATESARVSTQAAAKKFAKPAKYDRTVLDDGAAKRNIKLESFGSGVIVKDPYTGDILTLTKNEARLKYGADWTKHLAEADHKIALETRYEQIEQICLIVC